MSSQAFAVDPPDLIEKPWDTSPKITLTGGVVDKPIGPQPVIPPVKAILANLLLDGGGDGTLPWEPTFPDPRPKLTKISVPKPGVTPYPGPTWPKAMRVSTDSQQEVTFTGREFIALIEQALLTDIYFDKFLENRIDNPNPLKGIEITDLEHYQDVFRVAAMAGILEKESSLELIEMIDSWIYRLSKN